VGSHHYWRDLVQPHLFHLRVSKSREVSATSVVALHVRVGSSDVECLNTERAYQARRRRVRSEATTTTIPATVHRASTHAIDLWLGGLAMANSHGLDCKQSKREQHRVKSSSARLRSSEEVRSHATIETFNCARVPTRSLSTLRPCRAPSDMRPQPRGISEGPRACVR
jgi:hypothetical protein